MFAQQNGIFQTNNKWCAVAAIDGVAKFLGTYNSAAQATAALELTTAATDFTPAVDEHLLKLQQRLRANYTYLHGNLYYQATREKVTPITSSRGPALRIGRNSHSIHRVIWVYHHGTMPECIEHIDNNLSNNRIENLRAATRSEVTRKRTTKTISGYKGITLNKQTMHWVVRFCHNKTIINVGSFATLEQAVEAYTKTAEQKLAKPVRYKGVRRRGAVTKSDNKQINLGTTILQN